MKPIIIVPPDIMSEADIKVLRENELCVVVAKDPAKVKFIDPIPAASSRTQIENAAIQLSRKLLHRKWGHLSVSSEIGIGTIARLYLECLISGTPLDENGSTEDQEQRIFDQEKAEEIIRLARQEAKEERAAKKAQLAKAKA